MLVEYEVMGLQKKSESSASEREVESAHESDDSSGDFQVLNVSRKFHNSDESPANGLPKGHAPSLAQATKTCSLARSKEEYSRTKSSVIGGTKLEEWISSVRRGPSESEATPNFTKMIRKNKNFHNPAIFAKMISYCDINEFGTQFKDRRTLKKGEFYTDIAHVQDFCMKGSS